MYENIETGIIIIIIISSGNVLLTRNGGLLLLLGVQKIKKQKLSRRIVLSGFWSREIAHSCVRFFVYIHLRHQFPFFLLLQVLRIHVHAVAKFAFLCK